MFIIQLTPALEPDSHISKHACSSVFNHVLTQPMEKLINLMCSSVYLCAELWAHLRK
jgi:hypothetical protein